MKEGIFSLHQVLGAPDRALTTAIDRLNLERAVSQMPAGYRQVFLLHYVEGYGHREIARILGLSIGTSKSQLYKARVRLRQLLRGGESKQREEGLAACRDTFPNDRVGEAGVPAVQVLPGRAANQAGWNEAFLAGFICPEGRIPRLIEV